MLCFQSSGVVGQPSTYLTKGEKEPHMKTRTVCQTFYVKLELSDPAMTRGRGTGVNS